MFLFTMLLFSRLSADNQRVRAEAKAKAAAAANSAPSSSPKSESKAGSKAGGEHHHKELHVATHAHGSEHSGKRFAYVTLFTKSVPAVGWLVGGWVVLVAVCGRGGKDAGMCAGQPAARVQGCGPSRAA